MESHSTPSSAGRSAHAEYLRRRDARLARLRARFGGLAPLAQLVAGQPASERAWKRGSHGEVRTAERLEKLLRERDVVLLHDRQIPGTRANIDHLAIGPGGITVIDSKNYSGNVTVRNDTLRVNGWNRTKLIESMHRQIEAVQAALRGTAYQGVEIKGALAWSKAEKLPLLRTLQLDGVLIEGTRKIARLAGRPGSASIAEIDQLAAVLAAALPAA